MINLSDFSIICTRAANLVLSPCRAFRVQNVNFNVTACNNENWGARLALAITNHCIVHNYNIFCIQIDNALTDDTQISQRSVTDVVTGILDSACVPSFIWVADIMDSVKYSAARLPWMNCGVIMEYLHHCICSVLKALSRSINYLILLTYRQMQ